MVLWYSGRCDSSYYVLQAGDASIASFRRRYQLVRPKPKAVPNRKAILRILHSTASLFKQARQGRVTDKGKERVGSKPATAYAPAAVPLATADESTRPSAVDASGSRSGKGASAGSSSAGSSREASSSERVVYRTGEVVYIRPVSGGMWIAQLRAPIIEVTSVSAGRRSLAFTASRVPCRYFVPTAELASYPHALTWWAGLGPQHQLRDAEAAERCAAASSGVHFSFEKLDRVACTTVCGKLNRVIEPKTYRTELVSFAIDEEMLQLARECASGSLESDDDGDRDEASAAANAASRAAEAEAAAAARTDRFDVLAAKRAAGKRREGDLKEQKRKSV